MDDLNINVFNELNSVPDSGSGMISIFLTGVFLLMLIGLLILFFLTKKQQRDAELRDTGLLLEDTPHGIRITTPQGTVVVPTFPGQTSTQQAVSIIQQLLLELGIGLATHIIVARLSLFLGSAGRALLRSELKASRAFTSTLRSKNTIRSLSRSTFKKLKNILPSLSTLARVRYGMIWAKALRALGRTEARISAALANRLGSQVAAQVMERVAARAAATTAAKAGTGPLMVAELAVAGVGLWLDITDQGNYFAADARQTSELLGEKIQFEAKQKNSFIEGPENDDGTKDTANAWGFYPVYWGPLDELIEEEDADGLDGLSVLVEARMFDMLFSDDIDPFIIKFLTKLAERYGESTDDIESYINATVLQDMNQNDYWDLYDRAFDSLCLERGGTLIDPGGNFGKQCSHSSEAACHAKSPWITNEGPQGNDTQNITYTEWRNRDFFNRNYSPASLPLTAAGACIIQDPSYHLGCDTEDICAGLTTQVCGKNEYIRNLGVCQNTSATCGGVAGVSTCEHMRKINSTGDDCPTGLNGKNADLGPHSSFLLDGQTLRSCYSDTGLNWGDILFPGGSTILRYFTSGQFETAAVEILQDAAVTVLTGDSNGGGLMGNNDPYAQAALQSGGGGGMPSSEEVSRDLGHNFGHGMKEFGDSIVDAFTPDDAGGCFPGSSLVVLEDGAIITVRDVKIGQKVMAQCPSTGKCIFSEVFMWLVRETGIKSKYVKIYTDNEKISTLSSQHYIYVNDTLRSAQEVKIGDCLWTCTDGCFEASKVVKIEYSVEDDVISPVTVAGNIIVDSVLASCVTTYEDILGSSFPTLYLTKKTPPMMIHHWIFKNIFRYFGQPGVQFFKKLHAPLYILTGYKLN